MCKPTLHARLPGPCWPWQCSCKVFVLDWQSTGTLKRTPSRAELHWAVTHQVRSIPFLGSMLEQRARDSVPQARRRAFSAGLTDAGASHMAQYIGILFLAWLFLRASCTNPSQEVCHHWAVHVWQLCAMLMCGVDPQGCG